MANTKTGRHTFKVLICGGRYYKIYSDIELAIKAAHEKYKITHVITGGAEGCDDYASHAAKELGLQTVVCDALWSFHGKAAGPIRNRNMLDLAPDLVIAFPGGKGTANMVAIAQQAGIPVEIISEQK